MYVPDLDYLIDMGNETVDKENTILIEWLEGKSEVTLIEQEKKRFLLKEKWTNLIQYHKKKKVMLRHLKKN
eukprot:CAMPEP_0176343334 /NCGR_PEP_ID=MMETSP0126-20121128/3874_1 /TAXON_ID=141414 ORGANISM="Strombidinopsis acuminatum, Strain SPMC142" /NCGR_SAMPLE_ID=MMETSP0126 /ASSEMBLY_ACC=CAM_ASM_000229 /LENGTH=70 /DNA_ID=CAMNT_0017689247 /DNA_START=6326 /DNA_END=6541 /DNA_ORIENTATION=+